MKIIEIWKQVPEFEGIYEINNFGVIKRIAPYGQAYKGMVKKTFISNSGYESVGLFNKRKKATKSVHVILAKAFFGKPKKGFCVNHKNGIKTDNRLENIEYITFKENTIHTYKVIGKNIGEKCYLHKLKEKEVLKVRKLAKNGLSQRKIASIFNVHQHTIWSIIKRKTWSHI